jgi:DNA-directed RNA polymerase sigma subunit (sigma70/sigma32)
MAISVLKGYTYKQVGMVYGITGVRVRQITLRMIYKIAPRFQEGSTIKSMRNYKHGLISLIETL